MASKKFDLTGKMALITGAGGLLGVEHAAALLECGAKVVLTDIQGSLLKLARTKLAEDFDPNNILIKKLDVTNSVSIQSVGSDLASENIFIDILLNNAAIDPKVESKKNITESSRLENFTLDQWNIEIAVGLTGAFLCSQFFGNLMASSGKGGVIVNIASDLSVFSPDQRLYRKKGIPEDLQPVKPVTYSVIKSGLIGLTKYLSTYWADSSVRCNALSPGGVYNGQNKEFVEKISTRIPLGRMATVDEYRAAIQFLCSEASSYMNGQNLVIDGGRSTW
jgi:NAD(P)-dependent dehydrogenase (short-subunit alcohol dehydrogenase family)